ncbi:MAG: hypothetical protein OJF51_000692 [Nitrospira sp.]|jgi:hypothetical protein|nr:MAG: hypothetical protein OJF51_000692 [Nitrospira sp.]
MASGSVTARCKMKEAEPRITSIRFFAFPLTKGHTFCLTIYLRSATLTLFEKFVEKSSNRIRLSTLSETICLDGSTFS